MAITISLAARYWMKTMIMAMVCIVLGLWGVWDYTVTIPTKLTGAFRAETLRAVKNGLDTSQGSEQRAKALVMLKISVELKEQPDDGWAQSLDRMRIAVDGGNMEAQLDAQRIVEEGLQQYGSVTAPSKYDRPMQWMFILCLPFGLYYIWSYMKMSKKAGMYRLEEDGTLITPEGSWAHDEIVDIDLSRWIAKKGNARSTWTAKVILNGGTKVLLDDYVYQDMHLIIGKLAHQFYPQEWTPLARRVKTEVPPRDDMEDTPPTGEEEE